MTTQVDNQTIEGLVKQMRVIRDQISNEIKDMTFEEERAFLDKLLSDKINENSSNQIKSNKSNF
ncbi:MAG: hypothetical protein V5804_00835 [Mucilaginibacter sp.]|uniref:hypothetical protein n=1 Tax=Mucilaginibacter sp. TaxID=1882438 RepID=UPI0034E4897C